MQQPKETKTKLLDVAEKLFAQKGIDATSLRNIISEAGVNLAAIHYHFGSKNALILEVVARRVQPINEERFRRLQECENNNLTGPELLEGLIRAFLEPLIRVKVETPDRVQYTHRILMQLQFGSGQLLESVFHLFDENIKRFFAAFTKALPDLSPAELSLRFRFMVGTIHMIVVEPPIKKLSMFSEMSKLQPDILMEQIVSFLVAGFGSESPKPQTGVNNK
ncbi:MAG: TetR/AcrR family transcriptional regulator [Caldithrix sp.]|nr:MAG: TetR/AcrR family transcriptional regulator [Caldithrix sp.]